MNLVVIPCHLTGAIGAGVIGDIGTPAERGGFFGIFSLGPMVHNVLLSLHYYVL
jgi:hypothetical protein